MIGLAFHVSDQIRVDDVLSAHRGFESLAVEHVAFDDGHPLGIRILEPARPPQIQGQAGVGVAKKDGRGIAGELAVGAQDENVRHCVAP